MGFCVLCVCWAAQSREHPAYTVLMMINRRHRWKEDKKTRRLSGGVHFSVQTGNTSHTQHTHFCQCTVLIYFDHQSHFDSWYGGERNAVFSCGLRKSPPLSSSFKSNWLLKGKMLAPGAKTNASAAWIFRPMHLMYCDECVLIWSAISTNLQMSLPLSPTFFPVISRSLTCQRWSHNFRQQIFFLLFNFVN